MAEKNVKTSELPKADPIDIQPTQPYPTGSPPDPAAVVARVHPAQETTLAEHWAAQSEENLKAAGVIAGAAPYEAPEPPPEENPNARLRTKKWGIGGKDDDAGSKGRSAPDLPKAKR